MFNRNFDVSQLWGRFVCLCLGSSLLRASLASIVGTTAGLALTCSIVLAADIPSCIYNNQTYASDGGSSYWYAQVATALSSGSVYYNTQGGKGNLTTAGNPSLTDSSSQHVNVALTSFEDTSHYVCPINPNLDCHVQVGWMQGSLGNCGGGYKNSGTATDVYVEIFDNSSAPCFTGFFGGAPSEASYDARFYAYMNGYYRYNVYYQQPGNPNISVLAYAEFSGQNTAEVAGGEVWAIATTTTGYPQCPVLGDTPNGHWNILGKTPSSTFASNLQLYVGYWTNWTNGVAGTQSSLHETPQGYGRLGTGPYHIQGISNTGSGDFTQVQVGGPQ